MIPAKFKGDREAYKNFLRRLKNFRGWSDERLDVYIDAKEEGRDPTAANDAASLEESLPVSDRPAFRQKVKRLLDEVVKLGGNREIMRPAAEKTAFYDLVVDKELKNAYNSGSLNLRNLKDLLVGYAGFLEMLGVTPKEQRLAGRKSDESISAALARSVDSGRRASREAVATESADAERFNKPLDTPAPAPPAEEPPAEEPSEVPDAT